jgi:hypothetical protein
VSRDRRHGRVVRAAVSVRFDQRELDSLAAAAQSAGLPMSVGEGADVAGGAAPGQQVAGQSPRPRAGTDVLPGVTFGPEQGGEGGSG